MAKRLFSFFSDKPTPVTALSPEMISFLEQYPLALLLVDATGRITFVNPSAVRLLRIERSVLLTSYVDRFGLTIEKIRAMAQANPPKKVIIELVNDQADSMFVGAAASFLASTPFILLTLESIPHFSQLTSDNNFLRSITDANPNALVVQNLAGECLLWSRRAAELFGYKAADTLGQEVYSFFPKELVSALQRLDEKILQERASQEPVQLTYKNKQGKETVLSVSKIFLPAEAGKDLRILTLFEDITQRYYHERDLQQNRNLLRAVLENVPLGLYTRDCDNEITFYNRQSLKVLNETNEEHVSKPHAYQTQKDSQQHHSRELEILKEGKIKDFPEEEYIDSEGNKKILHLRKVPLKDAGPKPLVLSIVEDITDKLKQEKEIKRINTLLTSIVQNAPIGLYARTPDGRMLLRNQECAVLFGGTSGQDISKPHFTLPHETEQQVNEFLAREHEVLRTGKPLYIPEEPYVSADGTTKLLRMIKVPVVLDEKQEEKFVITLVEDITQRKAQEKDLLETKNFLQTLLDNVPVAIYARGANDKIMFINRRAHELFPGENENSQAQGNAMDFYDKRERSIFEDGKVVEFPEEHYTTLTGKNILLHLIKAPVFDKEGKPFMVLTVAEDITEKKAQEKAIIDAKNFLQAVINNLPVSLSVKEYDGKYILWNKKSEDLFGVKAADVIGKTSYRGDLNKEQQEFLRENEVKVFESKKEQNIAQELISTAKEGVKIMHTVKTPVFHEDGTPHCLIVVSEDITAKTRMEKQIREASDKNTLLIENAREGILLVEDYKVMYANRAICQILGYTDMKELVGVSLTKLIGADYEQLLKENYDAVLAGTEDAAQQIQLKLRTKNNQETEVEFSSVASRYLGRRIVLCFVRDISAFARSQRELTRERDNYRSAFEKSPVPCFMLMHNGYIGLMNQAGRDLFGLSEEDKAFYRNVYIRPGLTLDVRRKLREGKPAEMDYRFDFARASVKFPERFDQGRAVLPLHLVFTPMQRRETKAGQTLWNYIVTIEPAGSNRPAAKQVNQVQQAARQLLRKPLPPKIRLPIAPNREMWVLPNSEPYVLCTSDFKMRSCNELFCELTQLSEQELLGQSIVHIMDDESRAQFEADLRLLEQTGTLANRDYFINPASGLEKMPVRLTAVKEEGERYLFVLRNRTVQLQLIKVLEERSAQLNALLASTNGIVFSVQINKGRFGLIDNVSQQLAEKVGFSQDELTRMSLKDLLVGTRERTTAHVLSQAQKALAEQGKVTFTNQVRCKDESVFEAQISITALDLPGQQAALVVLRDVSAERDAWSASSKEAQELKSVRSALPGLYLKTDSNGKVLEVYSNLSYLPQDQAQKQMLGKTPKQYWPKGPAQQAVLTIKEALSMNIASHFDLTWKMKDATRYFDVSVTPIAGREEVVLWLTDISQGQVKKDQIKELYQLTSEPGLSITQQVDRILEFGLKSFRADVGFVVRFGKEGGRLRSHIMYVTPNTLDLERMMSFEVEECLYDVSDGNVLLWPNLSRTSCRNCVHIKKAFGSLAAAPLLVGGKVMGALCFASKTTRRSFENGAEELMGLLARLLSLRIELRQTGKMLNEASRSFARTLEYVDRPAVLIDLDYQITYINDALLEYTGRHMGNMLGRDFFREIVRNDDLSKRAFKDAKNEAGGNSFSITLEIRTRKGVYEDKEWQVVICKDDNGTPASYAMIAA